MLRVLERKTDGAVAVHNLAKNHQKLFFKHIDKLVVVEADSEKIIRRRILRDRLNIPSREMIKAEMDRISNSMKKTHRDAEFVRKHWGVQVFTHVNNADDEGGNDGVGKVYDFVKS